MTRRTDFYTTEEVYEYAKLLGYGDTIKDMLQTSMKQWEQRKPDSLDTVECVEVLNVDEEDYQDFEDFIKWVSQITIQGTELFPNLRIENADIS